MAAERKDDPGKYRDQESDQHLCEGENMTGKDIWVLGMVDSVPEPVCGLHNVQDTAEETRDRTGTKLKCNKTALWF